MARLNLRPSLSTAPSSRDASETPGPGGSSDQENRDPSVQPRRKGKERAMGPPPPSRTSLPTPTSDLEHDSSRGQKRKRVEVQPSASQYHDPEEERFNRYFDPNQDPEQRRQIKRQSRALECDFNERRDDLLRGGVDGLTRTIHRANSIYQNVKQTGDATLDSRLLVNVSDLAYRKTAQLVLGDTRTGVDVDEFLSKCITFMRNGGPVIVQDDGGKMPTQRRRRTRGDGEDENEDVEGEPLDWELLGRRACFPHNVRPAVPSFLLGPLSVEKKQRTQTQRRARHAKDTAAREARPEALTKDDLSQSDENCLTAICTRIRNHLQKHVNRAEELLGRAGVTSIDDLKTDRGGALLRKCRVSTTGYPSLFEYTVNPRSFGQTVENLFYVSFLIKEGSVGIHPDDDGLPTLVPTQPSSLDDQRKKKGNKYQAVFAIDYATWQSLVDAFEIKEPMIPHREEEQTTQVGSRGWYA